MLTTNERLARLEEEILELRGKLRIAGSFPVALVQAVLDQMVDEQLLPAATRAEIWGRVRQDAQTFRIACVEIADGAAHAIPHVQTRAEREAMHERVRQSSRDFERMRREILSPIPKKGDADPVDD